MTVHIHLNLYLKNTFFSVDYNILSSFNGLSAFSSLIENVRHI